MKTFPIQDHNCRGRVNGLTPAQREDTDEPVTSVPWSLVEPLRARCLRVHSQTLEVLAARGGLSPQEMWLHVNDLDDAWPTNWDQMPRPDALRRWLRDLIAKAAP